MVHSSDRKKSTSIGFKLTLSLISIVIVISLSTSILLFSFLSLKSTKELEKKTNSIFIRLEESLELPLWDMHSELVHKICNTYLEYDEVVWIQVLDYKGRILFKQGGHEPIESTKEGILTRGGELVGILHIGFNSREYKENNRQLLILASITLLLVVLGLSLSTGVVIQKLIRNPVELTLQRIRRYKEGKYEGVSTDAEYTELQDVLVAFNQMGNEIKNRELRLKSEIREREKSERQYRLLAENMEDVIWKKEISKKTTYVSPSVKQLRGYSPEEVLEQSFEEQFLPEQIGIFEEKLIQATKDGKSFIIELEQPCKNGSTVWVESHVKPLFNAEGNPMEFLGVSRNISAKKDAEKKKKQLEQQLYKSQKMESMGMLASGIAHDFNNILAGILGFSQLLREDLKALDQSGKMKRWNKNVIDCSLRARDLVAQILAFTRAEEEKVQPVDLTIILKEVARLLKSTLPSTIQINTLYQSEARVLSDATKMHQIVMNLCTNAAHAMKKTGGVLSITLKDLTSDALASQSDISRISQAFVLLSVEDTGHGMKQEILEKIFDPLFTTKPSGEGTGLGLSVVSEFVKLMGGNIQVSSEPDKGSRFDILLPVYQKALETRSPIESDTTIYAGKGRILFVDDEATLTQLAQEFLVNLGYEVGVFNSSVEAMHHFKANSEKYDLLITDFTMPELTGDKLCQMIREIRPDMPSLLITGSLEHGILEQMKQFDNILIKPVRIETLAKAIHEILNKSRSFNL